MTDPQLIDSLTRAEAERLAAQILRAAAKREPLNDAMQLTHLAIRLDAFADENDVIVSH